MSSCAVAPFSHAKLEIRVADLEDEVLGMSRQALLADRFIAQRARDSTRLPRQAGRGNRPALCGPVSISLPTWLSKALCCVQEERHEPGNHYQANAIRQEPG